MNNLLGSFHEYMIARCMSPHSIRSYLSDLREFRTFMESKSYDPLKLDRNIARAYVFHLDKNHRNRNTINRKRDVLKSFYRYLKDEKLVTQNPFDAIPSMKAVRELPRFLTQDRTERLLNFTIASRTSVTKTARPLEFRFEILRDIAILETFYSTGIRVSELVGLNLSDIDFRVGFIRVNRGKGGKDRICPIGETAMAALFIYCTDYRKLYQPEPGAHANAVFLSRRRMRITTRSVARMLKKRLQLAGIDGEKIGPHSLRHSFATHLLQGGCDIRVLAEMLGHARLSTTQRYTHLVLNDIQNSYNTAHPRA